jgi:glutaredoxin
MEGCHFCGQFKQILKCENIEFMDRDINQHNEEYELFRSVKNPTLSELFAPDIDFPTLEEAVKIIKERI